MYHTLYRLGAGADFTGDEAGAFSAKPVAPECHVTLRRPSISYLLLFLSMLSLSLGLSFFPSLSYPPAPLTRARPSLWHARYSTLLFLALAC